MAGTTTVTATGPGVRVVTVTDATGSLIQSSELRDDGSTIEFAKRPDGTTIERETFADRVQVTTTDADGDVTIVNQYDDGKTSQFQQAGDSSGWSTFERRPDGGFFTEQHENRWLAGRWEPGDWQRLTTEPDGSWERVEYSRAEYATTTTTFEPGVSQTVLTETEGRGSVRIELFPDNTSIETTTVAQGVTVRHIAADGTWTATTDPRWSDHTITTSLDRFGTFQTTDRAPDGTFSTVTEYQGGRRVVVQDFGPHGFTPRARSRPSGS